jgi:hypothetical protein
MNDDRAWLAALATRTTDAERRWYLRRQIQIARDVVLGATLKEAGAKAAVSDERARQILKAVQGKALRQLSKDSPPPVEKWNTARTREHAAWWCARLDELAVKWGVAGEETGLERPN